MKSRSCDGLATKGLFIALFFLCAFLQVFSLVGLWVTLVKIFQGSWLGSLWGSSSRSLKILAKIFKDPPGSSRILNFLARIFKDLAKDLEGSWRILEDLDTILTRSFARSSKILPRSWRIFKVPVKILKVPLWQKLHLSYRSNFKT